MEIFLVSLVPKRGERGRDGPGNANVKLSYGTQCVLHGVPENPWHMGAEGNKNTPPCAIIYHTYKHSIVITLRSAARRNQPDRLGRCVAEPSRWNLGVLRNHNNGVPAM